MTSRSRRSPTDASARRHDHAVHGPAGAGANCRPGVGAGAERLRPVARQQPRVTVRHQQRLPRGPWRPHGGPPAGHGRRTTHLRRRPVRRRRRRPTPFCTRPRTRLAQDRNLVAIAGSRRRYRGRLVSLPHPGLQARRACHGEPRRWRAGSGGPRPRPAHGVDALPFPGHANHPGRRGHRQPGGDARGVIRGPGIRPGRRTAGTGSVRLAHQHHGQAPRHGCNGNPSRRWPTRHREANRTADLELDMDDAAGTSGAVRAHGRRGAWR